MPLCLFKLQRLALWYTHLDSSVLCPPFIKLNWVNYQFLLGEQKVVKHAFLMDVSHTWQLKIYLLLSTFNIHPTRKTIFFKQAYVVVTILHFVTDIIGIQSCHIINKLHVCVSFCPICVLYIQILLSVISILFWLISP